MTKDDLLQLARAALADIANSVDMTLEMARRKAKRVYRETEPADEPPAPREIDPRVFRGNGPACLGCGKTLAEHLTNYNFCPGLPEDDRPAENRGGSHERA